MEYKKKLSQALNSIITQLNANYDIASEVDDLSSNLDAMYYIKELHFYNALLALLNLH